MPLLELTFSSCKVSYSSLYGAHGRLLERGAAAARQQGALAAAAAAAAAGGQALGGPSEELGPGGRIAWPRCWVCDLGSRALGGRHRGVLLAEAPLGAMAAQSLRDTIKEKIATALKVRQVSSSALERLGRRT